MKKFINFILVIFFIFLILLAYDNKDKIYIFYRDNILKVKDNIIIERNAYFKDNDYSVAFFKDVNFELPILIDILFITLIVPTILSLLSTFLNIDCS